MKGQRGRKSAASLSIVPVTGIQRPEPPPELSAEESAVWTATTRAMKPDWFGPETRPILAAYCLHVVTANRVAQRLRTTTIDAPDFRQSLPRPRRCCRSPPSCVSRRAATVTPVTAATAAASTPPVGMSYDARGT